MNILFLIPSLANGGQEKAGMVLCNYLMQFHHVTVVCLEPARVNDFDYKPNVVRIISPVKESLLGKMFTTVERIKSLKKIKQQLKPDVSIAFGNTAIILNSFCGGKERKIASIRQSLKGGKAPASLSARLHKWAYGKALKKADKIVPVSNGINKELKDLFGIDNNLFVHNGCDPEEIRERSKADLAGWHAFFNEKMIAHMGRYDASKCHWELVKIFHLVKERVPTAKLLLLGGIDHSDPVNERIYHYCLRFLEEKKLKVVFFEKQYSANELLAADVLIAGHQPNPFGLLSKASVFAFPSAWEGFPNSILEAMALGLVVASSDCETGPREILAADDSISRFGYLLPVFELPFNENEINNNADHIIWTELISKLLHDRELLHQLKERSLSAVKQFDHSSSNKKWKGIIEGQ